MYRAFMSYLFFFQVLLIYTLLSACIFATSNIAPEVERFDEEWPSVSHIDAVPSEMIRDAIIMERAQVNFMLIFPTKLHTPRYNASLLGNP